jgi:heterodisulfide reductase subunit C
MENKVQLLTETALRISGVNPKKCMKCGKCSGTCPNYDAMEYHPHQFVSMVEKGQIEKLMESDSIYMCLSCMACVERCPRGVEPGKLVEAVRLMKIRQQDQNHKNGNDIAAFVDEKVPQQLLMAAMRKYRK